MIPQSSVSAPERTPYTPVFHAPTLLVNGEAGPSTSYSSSSSSTPHEHASKFDPKPYLDYLSSFHLSLSQVMQEVPSSRPSTPSSVERIEKIREKVNHAYDAALGDPTSGKWGHVEAILKLSCTVGSYRWVRAAAAAALEDDSRVGLEGDLEWILPTGEAEWIEWEKKWKEEVRLKRKVESWQAKVDVLSPETNFDISPPILSARMQSSAEQEIGSSDLYRPLSVPKTAELEHVDPIDEDRKERNLGTAENKPSESSAQPRNGSANAGVGTQSSLGFPVVKRTGSNTVVAGTKKGKESRKRERGVDNGARNTNHAGNKELKNTADEAVKEKEQDKPDLPQLLCSSEQLGPDHQQSPDSLFPNTDPGIDAANNIDKGTAKANAIGDISESDFLPPSFGSQLQTSTPDAHSKNTKAKPAPIVPQRSSWSSIYLGNVQNKSPPLSPISSSRSPKPKAEGQQDGRGPDREESQSMSIPGLVMHKNALSPDTLAHIFSGGKERKEKETQQGQLAHKRPRPLTPPPDGDLTDKQATMLKKARTMPVNSISTLPREGGLRAHASAPTERVSNEPKPKHNPTPTEAVTVVQHIARPRTPESQMHTVAATIFPRTPERPLPTLTDLLSSRRTKQLSEKGKRAASPRVERTNQLGAVVETEPPRTPPAGNGVAAESPLDTAKALNPYRHISDSPATPIAGPSIAKAFLSSLASESPDSMMGTYGVQGSPSSPTSLGRMPQMAGSSQGIGMVPSSGGEYFGTYRSQFDVEGNVDRVSELLEKDVDFDGWLKDFDKEGTQEPSLGVEVSP